MTADLSSHHSAPSLVVLNTGDGKGKSSSAFGVMTRGWARGWKVGVVQFIKGGDWKTGEQKLAEQLGIDWHTMGDGFTWDSTDLDETRAKAVDAWDAAGAMLAGGAYDLLIFDEITYPVTWGWIEASDVANAISDRPSGTSVVMTGRDAAQELINVADTVTEMRKVKHAFDAGILAKKGIEY